LEENKQTIFRKKTLDRISSPDQLTDYLRVANPGIWAILFSVILLLSGVAVWSMVGNLETRAEVSVSVKDHTAQIIPDGTEILDEGMLLSVNEEDYRIEYSQKDVYGRWIGYAKVMLPDGSYKGTVITETVHPISFLLESR